MTLEALVGVVGGIIGAIGGTISIITAIRSARKEKWKEIEEDNDYAFLGSFLQTQLKVADRAGQIITEIDVEDSQWRRAEKMVERGILKRGPNGRGYCIPEFENLKAKPFVRQPDKQLPEIELDRRR